MRALGYPWAAQMSQSTGVSSPLSQRLHTGASMLAARAGSRRTHVAVPTKSAQHAHNQKLQNGGESRVDSQGKRHQLEQKSFLDSSYIITPLPRGTRRLWDLLVTTMYAFPPETTLLNKVPRPPAHSAQINALRLTGGLDSCWSSAPGVSAAPKPWDIGLAPGKGR